MVSRGVELIDSEARKQLELAKVTDLLAQVGRFVLPFEISKFPAEYVNMAFEAYSLGHISLSKLAELLDVPIEEAKAQLEKRNVPIDLGVSSEVELLRDIKNA